MFLEKKLYFLRHGQTDWNLKNIRQGKTDIPLNERGIEQAQKARDFLSDKKIDNILCSSLSRAHKTANIVAESTSIVPIVDSKFMELDMGKYEDKEDTEEFWNSWMRGDALDTVESKENFLNRLSSGIDQALSMPGITLIVGHGGAYWAMQEIMGFSQMYIDNCDIFYHIFEGNSAKRFLYKASENYKEQALEG